MARLAFILGCQRSGTTLLLETLGRLPATLPLGEQDARVMRDYRLLAPSALDKLVRVHRGRLVILKPLCDSQWGDALLQRYDHARVLWMYRDVHEVAQSAVTLWPGHFPEVMDRLVAGDHAWLEWRVERASPTTLEQVVDLWRWGDLGEADAAALFWYLRNQLLFDRGLGDSALVQLVRYDDLVRAPAAQLARIATWLGRSPMASLAQGITADRVGKSTVRLSQPVAKLCSELLVRLDACCALRQRGAQARDRAAGESWAGAEVEPS